MVELQMFHTYECTKQAGKHQKGKSQKHVWQRENKSGRGVFVFCFFTAKTESYLSPVTSLPLGAPSTSAAPLPAGFWGQT